MANQMAILRKVLRRIRRYWVGLVASLLLATLYVIMSLYIPILVGNAIDCIVDAGRVDFSAMWGYLLQCGDLRRRGGAGAVAHESDQQPHDLRRHPGHPERSLPAHSGAAPFLS